MKDRVLGKNGFEPFPERINEKTIQQGNKQRPADEGDPTLSDLPEHGVLGAREVEKSNADRINEQKKFDNSPSYKDVQTNEMNASALLGSDPAYTDPSLSDLPEHGVQGKKELAKLAEENAKAQAEFDKKKKK